MRMSPAAAAAAPFCVLCHHLAVGRLLRRVNCYFAELPTPLPVHPTVLSLAAAQFSLLHFSGTSPR